MPDGAEEDGRLPDSAGGADADGADLGAADRSGMEPDLGAVERSGVE
jgi:hypothetical protein